MNVRNNAGKLAMVVLGAVLLGGCAGSYQARSVDLDDLKGTLLVNPAILEKGTGDQALYRYVNPAVRTADYTKIMIEPVIVSKQAELSAGELENYQKLANNAYVYFTQELQKDYPIAKEPGPGVMRIQIAIEDADSSKPVRNLFSSIMPMGIGLSMVKYAATGKQSGVGEITAELRATDAQTGQLLGAALDRRVGGKDPSGIVDTWANADDALQYWAKKLRFFMCQGRGATNCVKP